MMLSQNYLREKWSVVKINKIVIWVSFSVIKIKLNCFLLYVVGYSEICIKWMLY